MARKSDVDWIAIGLDLLAELGHTRLTVADLCARSGRTKGSLYHHYADMALFRAALLDAWRERNTERLIAETEREARVEDKTRVLDRLAMALDLRLERAVRNWAAHDAQAREVVQAVDRQRIDYLVELCRQEGNPPAVSRDLSTLTYAAYLGLQQLFGADEQAALRRLVPKIEFVLAGSQRDKGSA
ncbi:TetR family transcriptional regulator [Tahibacter aquaticus]|uniref:TetR family transcriptional regulator n=2 Tax=Tahibacter aquaticus TaxID=520092 RepID=A0A4R6YSH9_9GAMM|nr:TetR family transcriptional regulator [Tahibacter aquaticus]